MKNPFILLFLLPVGLNVYSQAENKAEGQLPIIDMHLHTGLPHAVPDGTLFLCRPGPCEGDVPATADPTRLLEKTLR